MTSVHIIILNWNQPTLTIECLKSLEKLILSDAVIEVVVVDNNSTDNSVEVFNSYKKTSSLSVTLLVNDENLGFAEGNNVGIRYSLDAQADYVMILNNDTLVDRNIVTEFVKAAKKNPAAGMLSPKIYFAKGYEFHKDRYRKSEFGNVIWSAGGDLDWNNMYGTNHGVDEVDRGQFEKKRSIDFASGACFFAPSSSLRQVGLFDKDYYLYFEDADLSQRMKQKGWKVLYVSHPKLWHKVSQSSEIGGNLNDYFITRNRLLFAQKYASLRTKFALIRESIRFVFMGRKWQRKGVLDFYLHRFGRGGWE